MMASACFCVGGNPCPCQRRLMLEQGWRPPTFYPPYPYQPPDSARVFPYPPFPALDRDVEAMRPEEV